MPAPDSPAEQLRELAREIDRLRGELLRVGAIDALTSLASEERCQRHLQEEWLRSCRLNRRTDWPLSLLLLDIDFLAVLNDRYGAGTGDECLRQVGRFLAAIAQRPGDLAARLAGGRFALVLPGTDNHAARAIAESLRQRVAELQISGAKVTASLGVATTRPHEHSAPTTLLQGAESALRRAKQAGRNRVAWAADAQEGFAEPRA